MNPNSAPGELRQAMLALAPYFRRSFFFAVVSSLLVLAPTFYMFQVYGRVVDSRSFMTLAMLTLGVLLVYVVMEVLEWARSETQREAGAELDRRMASRVFDAVYESNLRRPGPASLQAMADFRTLRDFMHNPVIGAAMEAPLASVYALILFSINPLLGKSAIAGALVQVGLAWFNERNTKPPMSAANRAAMAAQQYADGSLRNSEVIESMGMLRHIHGRWQEKQREFLGLQAKASDHAGAFQAGSKFVQTTMSSAMLGLGAVLVLENALPGGAAMMIVGSVLGGRILAPLVQIVTQWRSVITVRDAWGRLDQLLQAFPAKPPAMPLPAPKGALAAESLVAAAPGTQTPILKGVTFALQPGEVLAVIGPSASGKTTLARLLVGLWPSAGGKVRLDGADVFSWDKLELGPHLGYLPQGVELLEGTLAENIARFGEVSMAKVQAAARSVGLHDYIMSLPGGYDSPVGRDGAMLSGGQRQRVALARAIYGDPVLVVLDEPNSSLDEAGDAALAQAIVELKSRGTTFVVMTHRTSVLSVADKLMLLRDGSQQAFGPRDEVLAAMTKAAQQAQQSPQAQAPQPGQSVSQPRPVAMLAGGQ